MSIKVNFEEGKPYQGQVIEFDEHVGLGVIQTKAGESLPFHCVNIADGSRTIALDTKVKFVAHWHPRGRFEAVEIELLASPMT